MSKVSFKNAADSVSTVRIQLRLTLAMMDILDWRQGSTGTYQNQNNGGTPPNNDPNNVNSANSQQLYQLCGNTANNPSGDQFGLGITLKVMAGDRISIYGKSVWHLPAGQTNIPTGSYPVTSALSSLLTAFANTPTVVTGGHLAVTGGMIFNNATSNSVVSSILTNANTPSNPAATPKAGINWILFDDQFRPVASSGGSGFDPVYPTSDYVKSHSLLNIPMIQNGYLYIFCSNESNLNVYFDNLQVTSQRGPIAEEAHYYPYGLAMAGISDKAWNKQANFEHFQGKEKQDMEFADGSGLEEYDFEARYYDPQIGRWHSPDPADAYASPYVGMGNNPASLTDPDGKCPWCLLALVGAVINVATHWDAITSGGSFNWGAFGSAVAVGAISGALGGAVGGAALSAVGVTGFLGGAFSGFAGAAIGTAVNGIGNAVAFGDPFSVSGWADGVIEGTLTAGVLGGVSSAANGGNFWNGSMPDLVVPPTQIEGKIGPLTNTNIGSPADNTEFLGSSDINVAPGEQQFEGGTQTVRSTKIDYQKVYNKLMEHGVRTGHSLEIPETFNNLGSPQAVAVEAMRRIQMVNMQLIEGPNNIITNIGGRNVTITAFVENGTVISANISSVSVRPFYSGVKNVIFLKSF